MPEGGSTLPRRQLGRYLKEWRDQNGLTLVQAAERVNWSAPTLQRLEKGKTDRISLLHVKELCRVYEMPTELMDALLGLAQQAADKSWWHEYGDLIPANFDVYMDLEASASGLTSYQSELVFGLLQTADYARAIIRSARLNESDAERERRVQMRLQRQVLVTRKIRPATVDVVLHESVLRRVIGGPDIMSAQLKYLAHIGTSPNITIRILRFAKGSPDGISTGPFTILDFGRGKEAEETEPPVVYVPSLPGDMYLEKPRDLRLYHQAYESILSASLDAVSSKNLLRQVAKEYAA